MPVVGRRRVRFSSGRLRLAALAGPDRRGQRAAELVSQQRLEAIHLAEIALAAAPDHPTALEAYIAAHQTLLAAAPPRNRWYQYWLKGEIAQAEGRLAAQREARP